MQSVRYSCQILIKLEFSRQISQKYSNLKLHENLRPVGAELSVRTDKQNEANNRFSQFFERFQI
jgi:hypothetical protein